MKKTFAIYGTGSSAESLLKGITEDKKLICFYETYPNKKIHKGLPVLGIEDIDESIDEIFIASIFYIEIIEMLIKKNILLKNFTVVDDTLDNPRYGPKRIPAINVANNLKKYFKFRKTIDFVKNMVDAQKPLVFTNRLDHLTYAYSHAPENSTLVEFGVYKGESLFHLAKISNLPVWGFDSFDGWKEESSSINIENINRPEVALTNSLKDYEYLVEGYFEDSLIPWIKANNIQKIGFVHYDAGIYEAAKCVLKKIESHLVVGSIIVFDEFIPVLTSLQMSEFQALNEVYNGKYKILSKCDVGSSTSVTIKYEG